MGDVRMKVHSLKRNLSAFLAFLLVVVSISIPAAAAAPSASSIGKNTAVRHEVCEELSSQALAYYTGNNTYENLILLDGTKTTDSTVAIGSPLFNRLHSMMQPTDVISYNSPLASITKMQNFFTRK